MWSAVAKSSSSSTSSNATDIVAAENHQQQSNRILICGQKMTGKSSIAFKLAYEIASEGDTVMFICFREKMKTNFPSFVTINTELNEKISSAWLPAVLSRIMIKYVANLQELKKICASIHTIQPRAPQCLIIDDFTLLIDPMSIMSRQDHSFIEVCQMLGAFISDAVDYLDKSKRLENQVKQDDQKDAQPTKLIIIADCFDIPFLNMMFRYTDSALILRPINPNDHLSGISGISKNNNNNNVNRDVMRMGIKHKFSLSGEENNCIFSNIKMVNGKLICTP